MYQDVDTFRCLLPAWALLVLTNSAPLVASGPPLQEFRENQPDEILCTLLNLHEEL